MNRYQKVASKLAKDFKLNNYSNSYNFNKNMYLKKFKENSWTINKVQEFKNNKKEKMLIDENLKIITDFIDSLLTSNTNDSFVNLIDFEIIDECKLYKRENFFKTLDNYFNSLGANYTYTIKDETRIHFSVNLTHTK